jgi:hypothetical protein
MNRQNILNFYGSKLDLKLDSSELYDYELGKVDLDYNSDVLDLDTEITYNSLKINNSLSNMDCARNTITLQEFDNRVYDEEYIFSGLTFTLSYSVFVSYFGSTYQHTILNNDVFVLTGLTNEIHYFRIYQYNRTDLPLIGIYGSITDNNGDPLLTSNGDTLIYTDPTSINSFYTLLDVSDDSVIVTTDNEELLVLSEVTTPSQVMDLFDKEIITCTNKLEDETNCCPQSPKLNAKPWAYKFDTGSGSDNCDPIIGRRTEKGWTLDFIFNRNLNPWFLGSVFYYIGVRGENDPNNYADNNLSFQFTSDRRIKWIAHHYSGVCGTNGYDDGFYIASGQTPQLCVTDATKDFNVTIVFDRYKRYTDCNLENDGGWNDLIPEFITNDYVNTGFTAVTSTQLSVANSIEILNKKWADEKQRRLGVLKIYLNGRPIYKLENWEEIIPSDRGLQPYIQSWGGGTGLMNSIHQGTSCFEIKNVKYYEEPLDFVHVRHNFLTRLNYYDFEICGVNCVDDVFGVLPTATPTPTSTPIPTATPTHTPTSTPTSTPIPTATHTPTATPTYTPSPTPNPTSTPSPTNTSTPSPSPTATVSESTPVTFNFDFDYMLCEYSFTDGTDMDTQTYISIPNVMSFSDQQDQGYIGTCAQSDFRVYFPDGVNPILTYGGDNRESTGKESVLFNLTTFKNQYFWINNLELTFTSIWYSEIGENPVTIKATLWKGGTPIQDGYTFVNPSATNTQIVESTGRVINTLTQDCVPFDLVSKFEFNTLTFNGRFF